MKRIASLILSLALVLTLLPTSFATDSEAIEAAQALYELGLFSGTGTYPDGSPNFDLDRTPTRAEAVTMLVRLLGKDEEAKAGVWETPFTDVDDWAMPYVGYAYANGLTSGTSGTTFGGAETINASQYLTFVLRALGYTSGMDFQWDAAWIKSDEIGLTAGQYSASTASFTRGDVAMISNNALSATGKNSGTSLLSQLVASGAVAGIATNTDLGDSKPVTLESLQGIWGNYNTDTHFEIMFEGNVATYMSHNSERTIFQAGPVTITDDGRLQWISLDNYFAGRQSSEGQYAYISYQNDFSRTGYEPEGLDVQNMSNYYTKVEKSTLYERCHGIVDQYEMRQKQKQEEEKAANSQSTGLSVSDRTALDNSLKSIQNLLPNILDNSQGVMAYLVAFSFGSGSTRANAELKINSYVRSTASTCKTIQSHTSKIVEILEREPKAATALRYFKKADNSLKQISSVTSVSNLGEINDWVSAMTDMAGYLSDGLDELISALFE